MYIIFKVNGKNIYVKEDDFTDYQLKGKQVIHENNQQKSIDIYLIILNGVPTWQIPLDNDTINILEEIKNKRKNDLTKDK